MKMHNIICRKMHFGTQLILVKWTREKKLIKLSTFGGYLLKALQFQDETSETEVSYIVHKNLLVFCDF